MKASSKVNEKNNIHLYSLFFIGNDLYGSVLRESSLVPRIPEKDPEKISDFDRNLLNWVCQDILSGLSRKDHSCLTFGMVEARVTKIYV